MTVLDWAAVPLLVAAAVFFLGGTLGLLRFGDVFARLHALTKAENVGFGLLALGLAVRSGSPSVAAKLALIWILVQLANATTSYTIGHRALPERLRSER